MDREYLKRLNADLQRKLKETIAIAEELEYECSNASWREEMNLRRAASNITDSKVSYEESRQMSTAMYEGALREGQYNAVRQMLRLIENEVRRDFNNNLKLSIWRKMRIKPSSALLAALVDNSKENTQKADKGQINSLYGFCKARHPDALLLFRYGSFFEIVEEDAIKAAKALAIAPRRLIRFSAAFLDLIVKDLMDAHHKIVILDLWPNQ